MGFMGDVFKNSVNMVMEALDIQDAPDDFIVWMSEETVRKAKDYLQKNSDSFFPHGIKANDEFVSSTLSGRGIENYALVDRDSGDIKIFASVSAVSSEGGYELLHFGYDSGRNSGTPISALVSVDYVSKMIRRFHGVPVFSFCTYTDGEAVVPMVLENLAQGPGSRIFTWTIRASNGAKSLEREMGDEERMLREELLKSLESLPDKRCGATDTDNGTPSWINKNSAGIYRDFGFVGYNGSYYTWDTRFYYHHKMIAPLLSIIEEEGLGSPEISIYSPLPPDIHWMSKNATGSMGARFHVSTIRPMVSYVIRGEMTMRWERIIKKKSPEIWEKYRLEILPGDPRCFCGWDD